ncbi:alpha/beta hydrolase [Pedobacter frigiditerrae]|uniref:alpha/beta hydrolase family protein n=1 Tax=Pedobacter frigiditerrae TaxID=2530452 RepID=UPI00292DD794|nr:alpha/beta hydrolase [Pedobacter frigiditerrae]
MPRKILAVALFFLVLLGISENTFAQQQNLSLKYSETIVEDGGSGQYTAIMKVEHSLPTHTVFRPKNLVGFNAKNKMPIIVWGNGACANSPWEHVNFLSEVSSYGFLVVAIGTLAKEGQTDTRKSTSSQLTDAINWAIAQNGDKKSIYYNKIDIKKIAVSGMSCGGLQTLEVASDARITTVVVCNSGIFKTPGNGISNMPKLTKESLKKIHTPTLYMLGGEKDIAYGNGMDDYQQIDHVPIFMANMDVGHGGTYREYHGGEFAKLAILWYKWQLKGDKEAAKVFEGEPAGLSKNPKWRFEKKMMP